MTARLPHLHLRVFLASPGDVPEERTAARELMEIWLPKDRLLPVSVSFDVVAWDHPADTTPMPAHLTPQEAVALFKTRPADCDIVVLILRARMGTRLDVSALKKPDGTAYLSGTEWEYEDAWDASPRPEIMVYRCATVPSIPLNDPARKDKQAQYDALETFLTRFRNPDGSWKGGINDFTDVTDFHARLETFLKDAIVRRAATATNAGTPLAGGIDPPSLCLGRDAQIEVLLAALTGAAAVTAAVFGQGGIGKTTLTRRVASDPALEPRFGARRWFVALETAPDAAGLRQRIVLALGLDAANPAAFELACRSLSEAPALLVLDNLETPWEADMARTEADLCRLAALPGLSLLISLRGGAPPGGPVFDTPLRLGPLDDPDARGLFRRLAPGIRGDDPDLPAFLRELGGIPLAIDLIARRAALHPEGLGELWARYQARGPVLARHPHLPEGRLTSVVRSLDLSWASPRLHEPGRRLFRLLGCSPAGLSRPDREALLGEDALEAAEHVTEVGLAATRDGRLDLLPPVRGYAVAMQPATAEETDGWCRHFLARMRALGDVAWTADSGDLIASLSPEVPNLEAALTAAAVSERLEAGIAAGRGYMVLARSTGLGRAAPLLGLADAARAADAPGQTARCLEQAGAIALSRSDHDAARARYDEALPLYRRAGSVLGEANCIKSLGDIALERSDHDAARARYDEALPLYRRAGKVLGEANCIQSLGNIALQRSDHDAARARYDEALPLYRRVGDVLGEANCIQSLGDIANGEGEPDAARLAWNEALALYKRISEPYSIGSVHLRLARAGAGSERAAHLAAARAAWESIDRPDLVAKYLDTFG